MTSQEQDAGSNRMDRPLRTARNPRSVTLPSTVEEDVIAINLGMTANFHGRCQIRKTKKQLYNRDKTRTQTQTQTQRDSNTLTEHDITLQDETRQEKRGVDTAKRPRPTRPTDTQGIPNPIKPHPSHSNPNRRVMLLNRRAHFSAWTRA